MSSGYFKIAGGTVYDPLHGVDGERRDIWIRDGKIVDPPANPDVRPDRTFDASGLVVMPGGVDMHCHIAGPKGFWKRACLMSVSINSWCCCS